MLTPALLAAASLGAALPHLPLRSRDWRPSTLRAEVKRVGRPGVRVTVVNFRAAWCGPCRDELPVLLRAHRAGQRPRRERGRPGGGSAELPRA